MVTSRIIPLGFALVGEGTICHPADDPAYAQEGRLVRSVTTGLYCFLGEGQRSLRSISQVLAAALAADMEGQCRR